MRARLLALAFLLSGASSTAAPVSARAVPDGPKVKNKRQDKDREDKVTVSFPSFNEVPQSPQVTEPGIRIVLEKSTFKAHEPLALFGTYVADGALLMACHGEVDTCIMITAIGRNIPGVWSRAVLEKPNIAPAPLTPQSVPGPTFRETGHFNLELRSHLRLPDRPGRYWLLVSVGDYITERHSLEVK